MTVKTFDGAAGIDLSQWLFLDEDRNVGNTNARFSAFPLDLNQGLVTGFNDTVAVPGPFAGAGLPGLILAVGGLLVWRRKRNSGRLGASGASQDIFIGGQARLADGFAGCSTVGCSTEFMS